LQTRSLLLFERGTENAIERRENYNNIFIHRAHNNYGTED